MFSHCRKLKSFTLEQLSGIFCFVQTNDGKVVSVYHTSTDEASVINFKKGVAAVFRLILTNQLIRLKLILNLNITLTTGKKVVFLLYCGKVP